MAEEIKAGCVRPTDRVVGEEPSGDKPFEAAEAKKEVRSMIMERLKVWKTKMERD